MEWMLMPYRRYFDFDGRSRRKEYWMFVLFQVLVMVVLAIPMLAGFDFKALSNPDMAGAPPQLGTLFFVGAGLLGIFVLASFIPSIAVAVRRLHDRDMSGWWYLGVIVAGMIPVVGFLANIAFLVLMCLEGTRGPNRFGADPKDPTNAGVFE